LAGGSQRWIARADVAGREFARVAIDVGFELPPVVPPETVMASRLLEFAGVEPVAIAALAIEQHLAEKLHAYTRTYAGNRPSSRVKDLVDVVVIMRTTVIDGDRLMAAVRAIFERRGTHAVPAALPAPPSEWVRPWAALVEHLPADDELKSAAVAAAAFWKPVLAGEIAGMTWEPDIATWQRRNYLPRSVAQRPDGHDGQSGH
jgi:hypothetical protein